MLKNLSGADIEFIQRSIRYAHKNKELSHRDKNRAEYLIENLKKDESIKIATALVESYQKIERYIRNKELH
tara:strand:+ start:185 stop:397 length:213 start_codon:yes stop_codon:yes gene_type:complete